MLRMNEWMILKTVKPLSLELSYSIGVYLNKKEQINGVAPA